MTRHRRDRFPLSVSTMIAAGVSAVWFALDSDDMATRRIAFAAMLVLLALAVFILGVQMWSWVRTLESQMRDRNWRVDERMDALSGRVGDLDRQLDSIMALVRHSRAHRGRLPAAELLLEIPYQSKPPPPGEVMVAPPERPWSPWLRRVMREHPGAASAAAAGVLVAAGAAGVAVLLTAPEQRGHPVGGPEAIRSGLPGPGPTGPATGPPSSSTPPPATVVVTVTPGAPVPRQVEALAEYVGVPVAARSQPAPSAPSSTVASGPPSTMMTGRPHRAPGERPCLVEVASSCTVGMVVDSGGP